MSLIHDSGMMTPTESYKDAILNCGLQGALQAPQLRL